jgi:hypothetical protein
MAAPITVHTLPTIMIAKPAFNIVLGDAADDCFVVAAASAFAPDPAFH